MRHERPSSAGEVRSSALWGKGSGGQSRGSALWGRGGRSGVALLALVVSVIIPAAGIAGPSEPKVRALVPNDLVSEAQANPDRIFRVIVQGDQERGKSDELANASRSEGGNPKRVFNSIVGTSVEISGKGLLKLARHPHVSVITRDQDMKPTYENAEMWRESVGVKALYDRPAVTCAVNLLGVKLDPSCVAQSAFVGPATPAIAIVDSGIDATRAADFGARVVARANFASSEPGAIGDPQGHGTMVAGIAAGASLQYPGAAPKSNIVDVRTADSKGQSMTSDVIAAVDWIIANKSQYNIRVANFSMTGDREASYRVDPLNRAVEKLWFSGVVVVVAAGNHGSATGPVKLGAPGNDPFVITVGALDPRQTADPTDDVRAPWSAYGHTADGYAKPDLSAPGRFMVMPVPTGAYIPSVKPERIVAPGYMWMSGTSFSAPVVAGAAAHLLAKNPSWGPDEVKGALMVGAEYLPGQGISVGVGALDLQASLQVTSPGNPNENLKGFLKSDGKGGKYFDEANWTATVKANANWVQANWTASNWTQAKWSQSNWVSANWVASNWTSYTYTESNWVQSNWTQSGWEE
jgi:serine protease AprX